MRIEYKRAALLNLQQTQDYIANTLKNKPAARKLVSSVLHDISLLANNSRMGTALNSRFDVDSNLRFLVVSKQLVFYQIIGNDLISIVRILDGHRDYISIFLIDQMETHPESIPNPDDNHLKYFRCWTDESINNREFTSDAEWYCRRDSEEARFYEIFFQMSQKYSIRWASADEKERHFIGEITRDTHE